ncbi:MAG: DUF58 domain-containing protein [Ilumatobacter sp.]
MTRYGLLAIVAGLVALAIGRAFGVVELFVIGAGFLAAVLAAAVYVLARTPRVTGMRHVHPTILVAGDTGRVDLRLQHGGLVRSARFGLREQVGRLGAPDHVAQLTVEPLASRTEASAGYQVPTTTRGEITLGPLVSELRDPLGLLRRSKTVAGVDVVTVAPRAHLVDMPSLGNGPLGRHLLAQARRLGPGEFHSLREYVDGDEPRSIHWRASARSDKMLVKQHAVEGLRRMLVVLDSDRGSYADGASFERAVTVAASLVRSATHADLVTRFVAGGVDLRGPDVATHTLRVLASIQPTDDQLPILDRDPGEGVGLLVAISGTAGGSGIHAARSIVDPTQSTITVTTDETSRALIGAAARTEAEFLSTWRALVGSAGERRTG